jgi:Pacifastin inhibitor (LCMII)
MRLDVTGRGGAICAVFVLLLACGGRSTNTTGNGPAAPMGCLYEGEQRAAGESFAAKDGCNSCTCDDGEVSCTQRACEPPPAPPTFSCDDVVTFYDQLLEDARVCDPHAGNFCTRRVKSSLGCDCGTFVHSERWNESLAAAYSTHYAELTCSSAPDCGACREPTRGVCRIMGGCEDAYDAPPRPACQVGGAIYPDGSQGIPDPVSCNSCTCTAGELTCSQRDCELPCPAGTQLAKSCAQCDANDACVVVEHACRATCTSSCAAGVCVDGACVDICG